MTAALVQPIAVQRSGTHEQVVVAAAKASVAAWLNTPDLPAWGLWLTTAFTKTVRRARPAELRRANDLAVVEVTVGDAVACGFVPYPEDALPVPVKRMQVSGTNMERTGDWPVDSGGPVLVPNPTVEMSTGKTAAQAAHALFLWALQQPMDRVRDWHAAGLPFQVQETGGFDEVDSVVAVRDAGRTEISPGTETFKVLT